MLLALGAGWARLGSKVDNLKTETSAALVDLDKKVEEIRLQGSQPSRTAIMVLNSRVDSQGQRLQKVEEAVVILAGIRTDLQWITEWVKRQMAKEKL